MTDETKSQAAKISKGPPSRNPVSYQTREDIVIPAGTILRSIGDDKFAADVGIGSITMLGQFSITAKPGDTVSTLAFQKVTAA